MTGLHAFLSGASTTFLVLFAVGRESQPYVYLVRLAAFVLIAWAVIDKNRRR